MWTTDGIAREAALLSELNPPIILLLSDKVIKSSLVFSTTLEGLWSMLFLSKTSIQNGLSEEVTKNKATNTVVVWQNIDHIFKRIDKIAGPLIWKYHGMIKGFSWTLYHNTSLLKLNYVKLINFSLSLWFGVFMADNNIKNSEQVVNSGDSFVQRPPSESTRRTWLIACGATGGP